METTIQEIRAKQKISMWVIIGIAAGVAILIFLIIMVSNKNRSSNSAEAANLKKQNEELLDQNKTLVGSVEKLNNVVAIKNSRDSAIISLTQEKLDLLPGIDEKINKINSDYEKNRTTIRNMDADAVQQYITNEAKRIRDQQGQRP